MLNQTQIKTADREEFSHKYQQMIQEGWEMVKHNIGADGTPSPMFSDNEWVFYQYYALFEKEK